MLAFFDDLRFSLRMFAQSAGFSATAVITLALGIGAATAVFTVADSVLLRPLPYPHPERVVRVASMYQGGTDYGVTRGAQYRFLQEQSRAFESLAANDVVPSGVNLFGGGFPERVASAFVSREFFRVIGVNPALGRAFTPEEDRQGARCVAVLTDGLWRMRYGGDPSIVRGSITVNGEGCSVVGVLPRSFRFFLDADLFMPNRIDAAPRDLGHYYNLLGRLKPGVTLEQARAELRALFYRFKAAHGDLVDEREIGFQAGRYQEVMVGDVRPALLVLLGAVSLLLFIACVNVANLQVSRAAVRARDMAVRAALGASRLRIARQLISESALLAFAGGICGLLLAYWGVPVLRHLAPSGLPHSADISVDWVVVAFAFALSAVTVLLFGVAPAMFASRVDLSAALKAASNRTPTRAGRHFSRSLLIGTEVALSVVLLTGSVLLMRSFVGLLRVAPGFDPHNVLTFKTSLPARYSTTARTWEFELEVLARLDGLPGVDAAASATCLPLETGPAMPATILEQSPPTLVNPAYRPVSPDYFRVLEIPLVRGRRFTGSDTLRSPSVAIINASFARQTFQDRNPIGQRLQLGSGLGPEYAEPPRVIVGVVGDVRETSLDRPAQSTVFVPRAQIPDTLTPLINRLLPVSWAVRTRVPLVHLTDAIRQAILSVDREQPAAGVRTMEQALSTAVDRQRFTLLLMTVFASLAMVMASVGIYSVVSYQVHRREREMGIRLALGAVPRSLVRMVAMREIRPVAAGVAAGVFASLAIERVLRSLLFETSPNDPATFVASASILAVFACLACYLPARRASVVDPMQILRDQ